MRQSPLLLIQPPQLGVGEWLLPLLLLEMLLVQQRPHALALALAQPEAAVASSILLALPLQKHRLLPVPLALLTAL